MTGELETVLPKAPFDFAALLFGDRGAVVVSGSISRRSLLMPAHDSP